MNKRQQEILDILQEECAEVIQAVSKVRRFGEDSNKASLIEELADLQCMIDLCYEFDILNGDDELDFEDRIKVKRSKLKVFSSIFKEE